MCHGCYRRACNQWYLGDSRPAPYFQQDSSLSCVSLCSSLLPEFPYLIYICCSWEASAALKRLLADKGIPIEGRPGGWAEIYRVYKECKFVEDEGDVVFFKNAYGLAKMRPQLPDSSASDSGIEVDK